MRVLVAGRGLKGKCGFPFAPGREWSAAWAHTAFADALVRSDINMATTWETKVWMRVKSEGAIECKRAWP